MIAPPPVVPHHDPALLSPAERAELVELQTELALDPFHQCRARLNLLLGRMTAVDWLRHHARTRTFRPTDRRAAPEVAPAPVAQERRHRDRERPARREWWDDADDLPSAFYQNRKRT